MTSWAPRLLDDCFGQGDAAANPQLVNVLSVDYPAADPALTAAGGTTLPITLTLNTPPPNTPPLVVSTQQVWGWDYLQNYFVQYVSPQYQNSFFPVGGGGGVSIYWPRPLYQFTTPGMRNSEPGQSVVYEGTDLLDLPAHFYGRNVPLNADPESGVHPLFDRRRRACRRVRRYELRRAAV